MSTLKAKVAGSSTFRCGPIQSSCSMAGLERMLHFCNLAAQNKSQQCDLRNASSGANATLFQEPCVQVGLHDGLCCGYGQDFPCRATLASLTAETYRGKQLHRTAHNSWRSDGPPQIPSIFFIPSSRHHIYVLLCGSRSILKKSSVPLQGLDNAHSTPLHVSRHVLSRVREADLSFAADQSQMRHPCHPARNRKTIKPK